MNADDKYIINVCKKFWFYNKQLSVKECAKFLNKDKRTIIKAINNKQIEATRVGKSYSINQLQFLK
tara:strand:+ start:101 stop:298 length:198 start_codon:yes stop_codon:yes gene_type:complete